MLDCVHALQARPVLEPDDMLASDSGAEGPLHVVFDTPPSFGRQVICPRDFFEGELGPYDEVNNLLVDAIWPVVVEDLDVVWDHSSVFAWEQVGFGRTVTLKRLSSWRHGFPLQALVDDEVHNRAILLDKAMRELAVPPQVGRNAVKQVHPVIPCRHASSAIDTDHFS